MKVFEDSETWGLRVNFVDDNNVVVGYDYSSDCCECFYWVIMEDFDPARLFNSHCELDNIEERRRLMDINGAIRNMPNMRFDTRFLHVDDFGEEGAHDVDAVAVFRLVNQSGDRWYLYLVNAHNGFYGHGWDMKVDGQALFEGTL